MEKASRIKRTPFKRANASIFQYLTVFTFSIRPAGVSARTLRYYDEIGLLKPSSVSDAGYRFYGDTQVKLLRQILFYRTRGFGLQQIAEILYNEEFDIGAALQEHLSELEQRQRRTECLIKAVKNTIASMKGDYI